MFVTGLQFGFMLNRRLEHMGTLKINSEDKTYARKLQN